MGETHNTPLSQTGATEFLLQKYHERTEQLIKLLRDLNEDGGFDYMISEDFEKLMSYMHDLTVISTLITES